MKAIRRSLRELGLIFPLRVNWILFFLKLQRVRALLRKINLDDIENLPTQTNRPIATSVKCLVNLFSYCSLHNDEILALYAGLMAIELTLTHGLSSQSATAFIIYGIVEAFFGHSNRALRCGDIAMKVTKRNVKKARECPTVELYLSFISHFEKPLKLIVPVFEDSLLEAISAGDVIYGGFCVAHSFLLRFFLGENLVSLERNLRNYHSQIKELSLDAMIWWSEPCLQFAINMRRSTSNWLELTKLSGEIMDEDKFTSCMIAANTESMLIVFWLVKAYLAYTFGYFELAQHVQEKIESQKYSPIHLTLVLSVIF
jgi:predicted ATPase